MTMLKLAPLFAILTLCVASPARCAAGQTCAAEGPRSGGAMLQTMSEADSMGGKERTEASVESQTQGAPLKGRVDAMEGDVASLKERLAKLQAETGAGGGEAGDIAVEEPAVE